MSDQGDEWMWTSDWANDYYDSFRSRLIQDVPSLPLCECGQEVKVGEDQCWSCLGEQMEPVSEFDDTPYWGTKLLERLVPALNNAY